MTKDYIISIAREVWGDDSGKPWSKSALLHLERFAELHEGLFFDAVYEAWNSAGMDLLGGDWNTFASTLEAILARGEK
jgi:hypothetical protein